MKLDMRRTISRILIAAGLLLLLTGLLFELVNLPWRPMLAKIGIYLTDELPDPQPLEKKLLTKDQTATVGDMGETTAEELPDLSQRFQPKADIPLQQIGIFKFPRLGISENIVEGSGQELLYGIGHLPGSAMPGEKGNCVLPAHRNYVVMHPFMHLDMAQIGDQVQVSYDGKTFTYEVFKRFSVIPEEMWVTSLQEGEEAMLTLITCSPGLQPTHRVIVWCRLVDQKTNQPSQATKA